MHRRIFNYSFFEHRTRIWKRELRIKLLRCVQNWDMQEIYMQITRSAHKQYLCINEIHAVMRPVHKRDLCINVIYASIDKIRHIEDLCINRYMHQRYCVQMRLMLEWDLCMNEIYIFKFMRSMHKQDGRINGIHAKMRCVLKREVDM